MTILKNKPGIIGCGFVGTACEMGFSKVPHTVVRVHDKFKPSDSLERIVLKSEILFICLPTPMQPDGHCDTSIIEYVLHDVDQLTNIPKTIVLKSTVPPGTTERFQAMFPNHAFVFNPEFLTEANFVSDFMNQKTVFLGLAKDGTRIDRLERLYSEFFALQGDMGQKLVICKSRDAEMLKYATNAFLATKLSFFNEIFQICKAIGVEYSSLKHLMSYDDRIGRSHTSVPGPDGQFGWSKSCFPKDLNALIALAKDLDVDPIMLEAAWVKNLMVREKHDWQGLPQVTGDYKDEPPVPNIKSAALRT